MCGEHRDISPKKIYGQQTYEKMFNITSHKENANQNQEIPPRISQNGYYQSQQVMCVVEDVEKGIPYALWVGLQIGAATMENNVKIPQKNKNILYDPAIPLENLFEENETNTNSKRNIYPYVHCSIIYNSQEKEAT